MPNGTKIEILFKNKVQKETHTNNLHFLNSLNHDKIQDIKELLNEGYKIHLGKEDSFLIIEENPEILL